MLNKSKFSYAWYVLIMATLTSVFIAGAERMCMPVLFQEISEDLDLSMVEIGTIWGAERLSGVFVALLAGLLVDRFGVKRVLTVICFFTGLVGALRGLSVNFVTLAVIMFAFGLLAAMLPTVLPKTAAVWFSRRHFGLANGIIVIGMAAGSMMATMISATMLSPLLGGWRNVLFLFGVPPIILSLLWFITGRESGNGESPSTIVSTVPFRQALSHVIRIKEVWIIGIIAMGPAGALSGVTGYLPIYLRGIGWTSVGADSILTVLLASSTVGTIPIALLSDRLGLRKRILVPIVLIIVISLGLLPLANGTGVLALVILYGLFRGGFRTLINTFIVEVKGVGKAYAGTAVGVVSSLGMLAAFFFPPLGNSLADINLGLPFVLWTGLSGIAALGFFFVKETGRREDKII